MEEVGQGQQVAVGEMAVQRLMKEVGLAELNTEMQETTHTYTQTKKRNEVAFSLSEREEKERGRESVVPRLG